MEFQVSHSALFVYGRTGGERSLVTSFKPSVVWVNCMAISRSRIHTNKSCLGPKRSLQDHIYQIMTYNTIINIYEQYTYIWIKTFLSLIIFYLLFEFMYVIVNTTNLLKKYYFMSLCSFWELYSLINSRVRVT